MTTRDVILTAYACSAQAPCSQWAREMFGEEPLVLSVPGNGGTFLKKGRQWGATGDAFRAAICELAPEFKDIEIGRRGLITLAAGWQLGHHLLLNERELELLDACILEDGLNTNDLDPWIRFATRAANEEAFMVMAHSQATPPYVSAKTTNQRVFEEASRDARTTRLDVLPAYLATPEFPEEGIRITVSAVKDMEGTVVMPAQTKKWDHDCLASWDNRGALYILEYEGNDRPDHSYIAHVVSRRLWRLLADQWTLPGANLRRLS